MTRHPDLPAPLLAIDASTYVGTVAVWDASGELSEGEAAMRGVREERLMPVVADTLDRRGVLAPSLRQIVCGGGPGSFTSLRIAAAIAKGIASAIVGGCELASVPSLALVVGAERRPPGRYVAALDAMRGEWYAQCFEVGDDALVRSVDARVRVTTEGLAEFAASRGARLLSPGGAGELAVPHARGIDLVAPELIVRVDLSAWEPDYGRLAEAQVKWEAQHGRPLAPEPA